MVPGCGVFPDTTFWARDQSCLGQPPAGGGGAEGAGVLDLKQSPSGPPPCPLRPRAPAAALLLAGTPPAAAPADPAMLHVFCRCGGVCGCGRSGAVAPLARPAVAIAGLALAAASASAPLCSQTARVLQPLQRRSARSSSWLKHSFVRTSRRNLP